MIRVAVLGLLALSVQAEPRAAPEEVAAMLLSPDPSARSGGLSFLKDAPAAYQGAVLKVIAQHAFNRGAWIVELEKRSKKASGELLARTHRMIALLQDSSDENLGVDVHFVMVPKEMAALILGQAEAVVHPPRSDAWAKWWKLVRGDKRTRELLSRAAAGRDGRPAMAKKIRETSYVHELVPDRRHGSRAVIKKVESGLTIRWTPKLSPDGTTITLETDVKLRVLKKPIAVEDVDVPIGGRVQRPEVTEYRRKRTVVLPVHGYAALRFEPLDGQEGVVAILFVRAAVGKPLPLLAPPRSTGPSAESGR